MRAKIWHSGPNCVEHIKCRESPIWSKCERHYFEVTLELFLRTLFLNTAQFCDVRWQMFLSNPIGARKTNKSYRSRRVFCMQGIKWSPWVFPYHIFDCGTEGSADFLYFSDSCFHLQVIAKCKCMTVDYTYTDYNKVCYFREIDPSVLVPFHVFPSVRN